jgi:hypothetical protein
LGENGEKRARKEEGSDRFSPWTGQIPAAVAFTQRKWARGIENQRLAK